MFKIKTKYKLELLSNETRKLLGDGTIIGTNKNGTNVPHIENVHSVLIHCSIIQNDYQQDSKLLHSFVPDKNFGQLLVIEPQLSIRRKTIDSVFDYVEVWFTDQDNRPLNQIEYNVNINLIVSKENT